MNIQNKMKFQGNKNAADVYVIPCESSEKLQKEASRNFDKEVLRYKIIFFLHNGGLAASFFYIAIIAKEHVGLSSSSLGAVLTVQMFLFTFTKPLIGYIADYFNSLKISICTLSLLNITCFFLLIAVPKIDKVVVENTSSILNEMEYNITKLCDKLKDFQQFSQNATNLTAIDSPNLNLTNVDLQCQSYMLKDENYLNTSNTYLKINENNKKTTPEKDKTDTKKKISDFYTYQFWVFAILFSISNICENANFTLLDTACCESIEKSKAEFGKLRLWGNVGWGLFSPIGGLLNDYTDGFLASTVLMAVLLVSFVYNILQLDLVKPRYSNTICRDVGTVFKSKEFLCLELVNLMNGIGSGITWFYLAWFVTDLGGSKLLSGLSSAVQSFGGVIPFMFFSGWIIRKVGHYKILSFTLMIFGLRFFCYSQLYEPWWILPIELSHGITYGLYYATLATYGKLKAKPGTEATTQSILFTTNEGLGAGIGCGFVGIGFDYFGAHQTFFYLSVYFGCDFLLSLLLYFFFVRKQKRIFTINHVP